MGFHRMSDLARLRVLGYWDKGECTQALHGHQHRLRRGEERSSNERTGGSALFFPT